MECILIPSLCSIYSINFVVINSSKWCMMAPVLKETPLRLLVLALKLHLDVSDVEVDLRLLFTVFSWSTQIDLFSRVLTILQAW